MARFLFLLLLVSSFAAMPVPADPPAEEKTTAAIQKGLDFLTTSQGEKGDWSIRTQYRVGPTALSVLAHLSAGVQPGDKKYGEALKKGVAFLLTTQDPTGLLRDQTSIVMYSHGLATWALAEYLVVTGQDAPVGLRPAVDKAVKLICKAQGPKGGWRYQPIPADGDLSITGWQLLALRAAARAGIDVPEETMKKGVAFVELCRRKDMGFTYLPNSSVTPGCTASGVLQLLLAGRATDQPDMIALRDAVVRQIPQNSSFVVYAAHYQAQVLARFPGKEAEAGLAQVREKLLKMQVERGSFETRTGSDNAYGPQYATPLAILALTARDRRLAALKPEFVSEVPVEKQPEPAGDPIVKALKAMTRSQGQQGNWIGPPERTQRIACTGLAILSYLSAGIQPDDKDHGPPLKRAVQFLLANQDQNGLYNDGHGQTSHMYSHGIATWALAEYYGAHAKDAPAPVKASVERAVAMLARAQGENGGWRYAPQPQPGDMSVTAWQFLALRAAGRIGVKVPPKMLQSAEAFVASCRVEKAGFSYLPGTPSPGPATTAGGLLHTLLAGAKPTDADMVALRDRVVEATRGGAGGFHFYTLFFQGVALTQFEGKEAEAGQDRIRKALLACQQDNGTFLSDGPENSYGPAYMTPVAVLALTAKDRKLVVFQKPQ
jgi:hypothetical protein